MKKIKIIFFITFFFSLFFEDINAEKSKEIGTSKDIINELSYKLKNKNYQYKKGKITGKEYEKEKKKILN